MRLFTLSWPSGASHADHKHHHTPPPPRLLLPPVLHPACLPRDSRPRLNSEHESSTPPPPPIWVFPAWALSVLSAAPLWWRISAIIHTNDPTPGPIPIPIPPSHSFLHALQFTPSVSYPPQLCSNPWPTRRTGLRGTAHTSACYLHHYDRYRQPARQWRRSLGKITAPWTFSIQPSFPVCL